MAAENRPLVSIVVPVYNVADYLDECVHSLLEQTYRNFELILVDDGSTDASGNMCDWYAENNANVVVLHKTNGGLSDARNFGVKHCHGDFVSFVDSDDYVSPIFLDALMRATEKSGCSMAAFPFSTSFRDGEEPNLCATFVDLLDCGPIERLTSKQYIDMLLRHTCDTGAPFRIYRKDSVLSHPFPAGAIFEDAATVYRIVHEVGSVALVPCEGLYAYRQRGRSIIHSEADKKMVDSAGIIGRQVERDMRAWYPDSWIAACSCGFSINRVALMRTGNAQGDYRKRLWAEMKRYRGGLLIDGKAKAVKRVAAGLSYLGMGPFLVLSRVFDYMKDGGVK